jgi:hypothetical protein
MNFLLDWLVDNPPHSQRRRLLGVVVSLLIAVYVTPGVIEARVEAMTAAVLRAVEQATPSTPGESAKPRGGKRAPR